MISGDTSIVVGEEAVLTCSSDFSGTTAEWLHNGSVLANSDTVASLEFLPVRDVLHGNEYICRINTSLYEPLVESITFQVDGMLLSMISVHIGIFYATIINFTVCTLKYICKK